MRTNTTKVGGKWRAALVVGLSAVLCTALCTVIAMWMVSHFDGATRALDWLSSARPAFAALQVAAMGMLWVYWSDAVAAVGRRSGLAAASVAQLRASRLRLWAPLALCVGLNVSRAFAA